MKCDNCSKVKQQIEGEMSCTNVLKGILNRVKEKRGE